MIEYKVGQTLWYYPSHYANSRKGFEVTVESVGRKWVRLSSGMRVEKSSRVVDGGEYSSPGELWLDEEEHQKHQELSSTWRAFLAGMSWHQLPKGLTLEKIEAMKKLLEV